jgi:hypothetical protein
MYGEKHLRVDRYETQDLDDDQEWNRGFDGDVNRFCNEPPHRDILGQSPRNWTFGSVHSSGIHCAMANASVHTVSYDIDPLVFRRLGVRNDRRTVAIP